MLCLLSSSDNVLSLFSVDESSGGSLTHLSSVDAFEAVPVHSLVPRVSHSPAHPALDLVTLHPDASLRLYSGDRFIASIEPTLPT